MTRPAQAFADHRGANVHNIGQTPASKSDELPYGKIRNGELPPMMFQIRMNNGQTISFAYSDVREIRSRDAGFVQIGVFAMSRVMITIEGRNLTELTNLLGMAMIRWITAAASAQKAADLVLGTTFETVATPTQKIASSQQRIDDLEQSVNKPADPASIQLVLF